MVDFYYLQIKMGKMTIDEVPEAFREEVQRMIDETKLKEEI